MGVRNGMDFFVRGDKKAWDVCPGGKSLLGPRQRMLAELYCFRLVSPSVCPWSL